MNSLYNITNKFVELMNNEELTEEQVQELGEELCKELQSKSTNIIAYIQNSDNLIKGIKEEEERLNKLRKTAENKLERFKTYVKDNMNVLGIKKIETTLGELAIRNNPMSIEIINENEVPKEFKEEKITISIDKTAIKNHFKETGEIVDGTKVIDNKTSLKIK